MTLCEWLCERKENALRIADTKTGADRLGWLEDAMYFSAAEQAAEALKGWQDHLAESFDCMDAKEQGIYLKAKAALAKAKKVVQ